jgi:hypothetical protein
VVVLLLRASFLTLRLGKNHRCRQIQSDPPALSL